MQPLLVGQRLALNPIIVFLALWFGGWLWGIAGIVMASALAGDAQGRCRNTVPAGIPWWNS